MVVLGPEQYGPRIAWFFMYCLRPFVLNNLFNNLKMQLFTYMKYLDLMSLEEYVNSESLIIITNISTFILLFRKGLLDRVYFIIYVYCSLVIPPQKYRKVCILIERTNCSTCQKFKLSYIHKIDYQPIMLVLVKL